MAEASGGPVAKTAYRISTTVYGALWLIGAIGTVTAFVDLRSTHYLGVSLGAAFVLISLAHQWILYRDLHRMDEIPATYLTKYANWFDTRPERILRTMIFLALMLGVGKIASAVEPVCHYVETGSSMFGRGASWASAASEFLRASDKVFVIGSIFLFAALLIWNASAFLMGLRSTNRPKKNIQILVDTIMNVSFSFLAVVGLVYWCLVLGRSGALEDFAKLIIVIYLIAAAAAFTLYSDRVRTRATNRLQEWWES